MPYGSNADLPDNVKSSLPANAQSVYRNAFNRTMAGGKSEEAARKQAWGAVKNGFVKSEDGRWVKKSYLTGEIVLKSDEEKKQVTGWFSVASKADELVFDGEDEGVLPETLRKSAQQFMENSRQVGEQHVNIGVGTVVESLVFTDEVWKVLNDSIQKMVGDDAPDISSIPVSGWFGTVQFYDDEVFKKVKDGDYQMFSIGGLARRVPAE